MITLVYINKETLSNQHKVTCDEKYCPKYLEEVTVIDTMKSPYTGQLSYLLLEYPTSQCGKVQWFNYRLFTTRAIAGGVLTEELLKELSKPEEHETTDNNSIDIPKED